MTQKTRPPLGFSGIPRPREARQGRSAIPTSCVGITTDVLILIHPFLISALQSPRIQTPLVAHRFATLFIYLFICFVPYKEGVQHCAPFFFAFLAPMPAGYRGHARCFGTGGSTVPAGVMRERLESVSWKPSERWVNRWTDGQRWMGGI